MAAPSSDVSAQTTDSPSMFGPEVPPLPANATPEQKDAHWYKYVYKGDSMPQLTLRAVLMGGFLGMLMCSANLYTTLKIGWAFGVAITACVMSYVLWTVLSLISGRTVTRLGAVLFWGVATALIFVWWRPILFTSLEEFAPSWGALLSWIVMMLAFSGATGLAILVWNRHSKMSMLENNCMQSTASAAGYSTGSTIATMFGALLLLEKGDSLTIKTLHVQPIWMVAIFTFCTGLMGVFLAIPMKRQMINHEQLPFPSGIAAAETLRSLYSESREAVLKAYSLVIALAFGALVGIINTASGTLNIIDKVLGQFRLPEQIPEHGFATVSPDTGKLNWFWGYLAEAKAAGAQTVVGKQLIQFGFEPSVLLIAAGMIVGLRVSLTMLAGSILLYVFVAPRLIAADTAMIAENTKLLADPAALAQKAQSLGMSPADYADKIKAFHPTFDLLGGEVFHVYRWALWGGTALMVMSSLTALAFQWKTIGRAVAGAMTARKEAVADHDSAMKAIEVPLWWMVAGMIPLTIAMVILQIVAFNISWYAGVIAVLLSFILSLVACRATGETDTTPIGAMGKVMQLTFALLHPGQVKPNLASAGIAANSASSSADLLTDLKSGYLLGANPRKQFLAQFFGCFFGTVAILPVWYLMVPTKAVLETYPAPGTQSWYRVAQVLTQGFSTLPDSAKYALAIGIALGIILPIVEKFVIPDKYKKYWPSTMGLGLSWVVGFNNSLAFALGSVIAWVWGLINKKSRDTFNVPIASGLVAGESLIKAAIAMLATISGLAGWHL